VSETRIRWHAPAESTVVAEFGYVGTLRHPSLFQILKPVTRELSPSRFDEWSLVATFPGAQREALYASSRDKAEAVAELRTEAERWLERFVASLGASFPPGPVVSRCECGGLASHQHDCRWRQGYGSLIESVAETAVTAAEGKTDDRT